MAREITYHTIDPAKYYMIAGYRAIGSLFTYEELNKAIGFPVQKKQANYELGRLGFVHLRWMKPMTWRRDSIHGIDPYIRGEELTYDLLYKFMAAKGGQPSWSMKELKIALGFHPTKASIRAMMPRMGFAWDDKAHRWIKE